MSSTTPLLVFCHLRWNFVFQRPQHLMTRIARQRPVYFIEEPVPAGDGETGWELSTPADGVTVCRAKTRVAEAGFSNAQLEAIRPLIAQLMAEKVGPNYDLWFYTPLALPLADDLSPQAIIYDCMDELSAFKFAPPELLDREQALLDRADLVFTGGPSLYRSKKDRHPSVHCFSSSVDAAHFGRASGEVEEPAKQAELPHPRLGFFGVIDERFDVPLLAELAELRPDWQFIFVGPVVKIDPAELPRRSNIHYFGQRDYGELPAFLHGWDVALLPFARNESTRFISPTKTLEYMAAGKPIVSTPITDVAEPYGSMVGLGSNTAEFLDACERALNETPAETQRRNELYRGVLARTSWDATAAAMMELIDRAEAANRKCADLSNEQVKALVIGAGPTGLSAAYHLGEKALLIEANDRVGGWCRSLVDRGFTFDFAGHIMFSNDPYVHKMYEMLLGDNVHWQDREAWIYSHEVYTRYPFQGSLYGLPPEVIKECIVGAIEARFGSTKKPPETAKPSANGHPKESANPLLKMLANGSANGNGHQNGHANGNGKAAACSLLGSSDPKDGISDCCGDGVAESTVPLTKPESAAAATSPPKNFEEFIDKVWGAGIAKHFAIPYNRKIWAVPLDQMETSWLGGRVPQPDLEEMIEGALTQKPKPMGPNARFGYPLRGGFQALMDGFLPKLHGTLRLNSKVASVSPSMKVVTLADGSEIRYEKLISTMPLPALIRSMGEEAPDEVRRAAAGLRYTSVRCVNIGVGREKLTEKHWIYYPGETVFHRIFVQGNASPHCNPPGGFGLTCEITYGPLKPLPCDGDDLIRRCIKDCIKVGFFNAEDAILAANQIDMPFAYVVYDHARPKNVGIIRDWLSRCDIHLAGRYSEWEYYNSDHAFLAGKKVADEVDADLEKRMSVPVAVASRNSTPSHFDAASRPAYSQREEVLITAGG